jgi:nucleoside-diphosphate-sugar epimerase
LVVVDAWVLAIEAPVERVVGQKFQVSYEEERAVGELVRICRDAVGKDVPLEFVDYRPGERGQREAFSTEFDG